jgi:hypothetical protein
VRIPVALALGLILIPALGLAGIGHAEGQVVAVAVVAAPVPIWGVVLGTVLVAGLLYLIVHGPDGHYYRYPYYGEYYRHYYHPEYRPYTGFYASSAVVVTVAPRVAGVVLGVVLVDGHHYILSRDAGGRLYRYPYYGPYRQVYYKPDYHEYRGPYVENGASRRAALRQGDAHWDSDKRILAPDFQRPRLGQRPNQPVNQPQYHRDQHQAPQYQRDRQQPNPPARQPQYHRDPQQPNQRNSGQTGGRDTSAGGHRPQHECGHSGEPSCPGNMGQHP